MQQSGTRTIEAAWTCLQGPCAIIKSKRQNGKILTKQDLLNPGGPRKAMIMTSVKLVPTAEFIMCKKQSEYRDASFHYRPKRTLPRKWKIVIYLYTVLYTFTLGSDVILFSQE